MSSHPKVGSAYIPNYVTASRINNFCKNTGSCDVETPYIPPPPPINIPNLNTSLNSQYPIVLFYIVNANNSVTFSGNINKSNFSVNGFDIFPNNVNYTIDYTFNNVSGDLVFTINNYLNDTNISIYINGSTQFASTIHSIVYYNNHVISPS